MIECLWNISTGESIFNHIQKEFEELCELEKERLIKRKGYLINFE